MERRVKTSEQAFELLAGLTARLASTASLDELVDTVLHEIIDLGFGAVWMAVLDDDTQNLVTLKEVIDGVDTTHEMPKIFMLDMRQPIGHGFRERRMINIVDPDSLWIIERDDDLVPPDRLALPRVIYEHMRGHPFACGPLLGSRGQPVGALGLSSYLGHEPIPDELFTHGLLRAFMDNLGIAMERALHLGRLEKLNADLVKAQAVIARDARIKAVGELAAAVAHDLNNLCNIALLAAEVGMRSPAQSADALQRIERANRAIGELVGRLQRVARHGAVEGEQEDRADLREIVQDIVAMVGAQLREQAIVLDVDVPTLPSVSCDPVLLHQLVLNLLLNAQDVLVSVPPDRRRIQVRASQRDSVVVLTVHDTGPGISEQVLPQLFQPFVTTKGQGHLGLGLAAARASLKHFGGKIEAHNAAQGAVFEVTLVREPEASVATTASSPPPTPEPPRHHGRILAIDDDPDVVDVIRLYLQPMGYDVECVTRPEQVAGANDFDLVLCDVGMPQRSGLDVCESLRNAGYHGKLILMTGWDSQAVKADRRAAFCDMVLKKPFLGPELVRVIDSLLVP